MFDVVLAFITSFLLTYLAIPSIIKVAKIKKLYDEPGERHAHSEVIPTLGGIAIFAGVLFSIIFWTPFGIFGDLQYILCAMIIIFLIGAKDDIEPIAPTTKMVGQFVATLILIFKSDVRITSFYGLFGITELPGWGELVISVFTILVIINAFNLIDGINGLSASIGAVISVTLGTWFFLTNNLVMAIIAFALLGALIAFLKYNYTPAKIFMGDTGSLLLGLISAILALKFIEINKTIDHAYRIDSVPAVAIGILIIPLFDTLRIFTTRMIKGKSPFRPDKTHVHHYLLDLGFSHMQSTGILVFINMLFIGLAFMLQHIGILPLVLLLLALASILMLLLVILRRRRNELNQSATT